MIEFYSPRDPDESRVLTANFVDRLVAGETIASATWEILTEDGAVVTLATMTTGAVDYSTQPLVKQTVKGGSHGITYLHRAKAVTNTGRPVVVSGWQLVYRGE